MLRKLFPWLRPKDPNYPYVTRMQGPRGALQFVIHNSVERHRILEYGNEREFLSRFLAELKPTDVLYDIGASVGLMAVHAASVLEQGMVYAFEPDPETNEHLEKNIAANNMSNIRLLGWAVSDDDGITPLYTDGADGYAPSMRLQEGRVGAPSGRVDVQTRSLDSAVANSILPIPTVLKIDVEGAEIFCIRGAKRLLQGEFGAKPRSIYLELHPNFLESFGSSVFEVKQLVELSGYREQWSLEREDQLHCCYQSEEA